MPGAAQPRTGWDCECRPHGWSASGHHCPPCNLFLPQHLSPVRPQTHMIHHVRATLWPALAVCCLSIRGLEKSGQRLLF